MALPADLQEALNRLRPKDEGPSRPDAPPVYVNGEAVRSLTDREDSEAIDPDSPEPESDAVRSDQTDADIRERLAAETATREARDREVEFLLRQREAPQHQAHAQDPMPTILEALRVTPEQWTTMVQDPDQGSRMLTEMAHRMFLLGNQVAKSQVLAEVSSTLDQRDRALATERQSENLQAEFWRRNPDLEPYKRTVIGITTEVAEEQGQYQRNVEQIMDEVSKRTRKELTTHGIKLGESSARRKITPARADMGGSAGRPTPVLTPKQRQMYRLAGLRG